MREELLLAEIVIFFQMALIVYLDLKTGKIKNKLLLLLLISQIIFGALYGAKISLSFLKGLVILFLISFFFWFIDLIPPGDSKFLVIAPLHLFFISSIPMNNLVWIYLLSVFVPFFIIYFVIGLYRAIKRNYALIKKSFLEAFSPYNIFILLVVFLGIVGFISDFMGKFPVFQKIGALSWIILVILLFFFSEVLMKYSPINMEYIYVIFAGIRIILMRDTVFTAEFWLNNFFVVFTFIFFRYFILKISYELETVEVDIDRIKPGMRLAEVIVKEGDTYSKIRAERYSLPDYLKGKFMKAIHSTSEEGLSKEDVKKIKKLKREGKLTFEKIRIYKTMPFGLFVFLGNLITLLYVLR